MFKCKCGEEFSNLMDLSDHVVSHNPEWPKLTNMDHGRIYEEYEDEEEDNKDEGQPLP
jgi:hypothetical protein